MVVTVNSKVEANRAIEEQNPFAQPPFVHAKHVWGKQFPDIESLNAHASDAVFKALDEIRAGHYSTTSLLITAQNGTGKTHIISRIRHRLKQNGQALFVFANQFNDLNEVKEGFQKLLAVSLGYEGSQKVSQWQEVASRIASVSLEILKPGGTTIGEKELIKKFTKNSTEKVGKWIQKLGDTFCIDKDIKDPEIVKAILWCLSENQKPHAVNWLGGEELAQYKANELRLPSQRRGFDTVLQTLNIISRFYELVICFDELDVNEFNEPGLHKSQVVAGLVKDLFENLNRGLILSTMMPGTWNERVKQLPGGVWNKMTAQGKPYDLKYLDEESILELVEFSLDNFYLAKGITPPYSIYPFDETQLRTIGKEKPTVREVLKWCRENCHPQTEEVELEKSQTEASKDTEFSSALILDNVNEAFLSEFQDDCQSYWEDNRQLGNSLQFSIERLIGKQVEGIKILSVSSEVKSRGGKDPYLNFKISGKEGEADTCIGVAVLQNNGGKGLGAGFRRLLDKRNKFGLTRGCLVRSQKKSLSYHFRKTYLEPLINEKGGEFVDLKLEEVQSLIAIYNVYRKRNEYDLTEEQIYKFIENSESEKLLGVHNPLVREILSAPSQRVPETEDEPELDHSDPEELLEQSAETSPSLSNDDSEADLDLLGDEIENSSESDALEELA